MKLLDGLKKIISLITRRKMNRKIFKKYRRYMSCGIYYLKRIKNKAYWDKERIKFDSYKSFIRLVMYGVFIIKTEKKSSEVGSFDSMMIRSDKSVKMFNYRDKVVLTIQNNDAIHETVRFKNNMGRYINNPIIDVNIRGKEAYVIEDMVVDEPIEELKKIEWIYDSYYDYFISLKNTLKKQTSVREVINRAKQNYPNYNFYKIENVLESIQDKLFWLVVLHGDIKIDNILFHNKKFNIIDYDFCDYEIYFYDIFFPLIELVLSQGNYILLNKYFDGYLDCKIAKIFSCIDEKYNQENKKEYLYLSILIALNKMYSHKIEIGKETWKNIEECIDYIVEK